MNHLVSELTTFKQALTRTYLEHPCQVLPNALWKTRARLDDVEKAFVRQDERVTQLSIWGASELFTFWSRNRLPMDFPFEAFKQADLMLLHEDYISSIDPGSFPVRRRYFRLSYSGSAMPKAPPGWRIREAAPEVDTEDVAAFIRQCYPGSRLSAETVRKWETYPVHDPSLWIWVEDNAGRPIGLGIAEYDPEISEGSLEWIQVLPSCRRMGVGQVLVATLVRRLRPQSVLITVSGEHGSASHPDMLYRKCGFVGNDAWWMLRRDELSRQPAGL